MVTITANKTMFANTVVANLSNSTLPLGYSDDVKQLCLKMYLNGMGFRGIERVTGINHNTIINWVKQAGRKAA